MPAPRVAPSDAPLDSSARKNALEVRVLAQPHGPAEVVREFLLDLVYGARSGTAQLWDDFRSSDRFFKYKAAVIGLWALISIFTMFFTCSHDSRTLDASNPIGAFANFQRSANLGVSVLLLENHSDDRWNRVSLTINDRYSTLLPYVERGGRSVVEVKKFNGPKGETPPADFRVRKLEIRCSEGTAVLDMAQEP